MVVCPHSAWIVLTVFDQKFFSTMTHGVVQSQRPSLPRTPVYLPLCVCTSLINSSEISITLAVEISVKFVFAKAVNEFFIDDSISTNLESTLTSKIAVNSAAAGTVTLVIDERLKDLAKEFESSVILTSRAVSPGENIISPIFAVSTYSLLSKALTSSSRTWFS